MDEDLTASHWDDVIPSPNAKHASSNLGLIFDTLSLDDPHRDPHRDDSEDASRGFIGAGLSGKISENSDQDESDDDKYTAVSRREDFRAAYRNSALPFNSSNSYNQSEIDELNAIKKQERDTRKTNLLMELTSEVPEELNTVEPPVLSAEVALSKSLFEDKGSPLKFQPLVESGAQISNNEQGEKHLASPNKTNLLKMEKFKVARGRRIPSKTIVKHLSESENDALDPLSPLNDSQKTNSSSSSPHLDKVKDLFRAADLPLYDLPKSDRMAEFHTASDPVASQEERSKPSETTQLDSNDLEISLGDPVKVGDITTAHIVYGITTVNKNPKTSHFPKAEGAVVVSRRYKDFRWIYHQLQNNHPGKIIPPPPAKQTYIGRFNENFVENRRQSLEKMLQKISRIPALADDADFVLFLTSQNFANDAKEREQASGSSASIHANSGDDEGDKTSTSAVTGTGASSFMSSLFSMAVKYPEPEDFFSKKKAYIEDLEHNLKTFYKSLELIASQRVEIAAVVSEIATIVEELADLEILKTTTDLLSAFAEVQGKLRENLDRVNLQDQLTLGFTIEEYLRIIGSVKYTFETRSKIYQLYQSFKQDLVKKEESLDRLNSRYKSSIEKINLVSFEVDKLKQKVAHYEHNFNTISDTIKAELDNFEMEKIKDFRNSVEIFIESSIESQKEAIELWETFYERHDLAQV